MSGWHLVLGGSHGIGFAYAMRCASMGGSIHLVARTATDLERSAQVLRSAGAKDVELSAGDVTDPRFRTSLSEALRGRLFATIFVGGPSPAAGRLDGVSGDDVANACQIVLVYPLWVIRWALGGALETPGVLILLSSAAADSPVRDSPFALSAIFRRSLDLVAKEYANIAENRGQRVAVWKPGVVLTRLALRYAGSLTNSRDEAVLVSALRSHLGAEPLDAGTYIAQACQRTEL